MKNPNFPEETKLPLQESDLSSSPKFQAACFPLNVHLHYKAFIRRIYLLLSQLNFLPQRINETNVICAGNGTCFVYFDTRPWNALLPKNPIRGQTMIKDFIVLLKFYWFSSGFFKIFWYPSLRQWSLSLVGKGDGTRRN